MRTTLIAMSLYMVCALAGCGAIDSWASADGVSRERVAQAERTIDDVSDALPGVVAEIDRLRMAIDGMDVRGVADDVRDRASELMALAIKREQDLQVALVTARGVVDAAGVGSTRGEQLGRGAQSIGALVAPVPVWGSIASVALNLLGGGLVLRYKRKLTDAIDGAAGIVRSVDKALGVESAAGVVDAMKVTMAMSQGTKAKDLYEQVRA